MNAKNDSVYQQSGVIAYRMREGNIEVLLIKSRKGKRWVIPKGMIEPNLSAKESALHEAYEEAGIAGNVSEASIGFYDYKKWGGTCRVEVFVLHVQTILESWPEDYFRRRCWHTMEDAVRCIPQPELKVLIASLPEKIDYAIV